VGVWRRSRSPPRLTEISVKPVSRFSGFPGLSGKGVYSVIVARRGPSADRARKPPALENFNNAFAPKIAEPISACNSSALVCPASGMPTPAAERLPVGPGLLLAGDASTHPSTPTGGPGTPTWAFQDEFNLGLELAAQNPRAGPPEHAGHLYWPNVILFFRPGGRAWTTPAPSWKLLSPNRVAQARAQACSPN